MTAIMRTLAAAAVVLTAGTAHGADVAGLYAAAGTNFDGSGYEGTALIQMTGPTTCTVTWQTGGATSAGHCMVRGNVVAASYTLESGHVGLVLYDVLDDGRLDGVWTANTAPGQGTEVLTPQ